jgi:hypothetical protein
MAKDKGPIIYQLKITLSRSKPTIWRRFLVKSEINLYKLHSVIQIVMGWTNSHMHHFRKDNVFYGTPHPDMELGWALNSKFKTVDEEKYKINEVLTRPKMKIQYEYDFGDSWWHELVLEKILEREGKPTPICVEGAMACPPEDCGSPGGYYTMLETMENPEDPEYDEICDWMGDEFDPEEFNIEEINKGLKRIKNA